jgi:RsiW-degrading membrane proteinase PrsW (M82 family)
MVGKMPRLRHWLIHRSRDRNFLLRTALIIGGIGILGGFVASKMRSTGPDLDELFVKVRHFCPWYTANPEDFDLTQYDVGALQRLLEIPEGDAFTPDDLAEAVRQGAYDAAKSFGLPDRLLANDAERTMFWEYGFALHKEGLVQEKSESALKAAAGKEPAARFANEFYADIRWRDSDLEVALAHFQKEIEIRPETTFSRSGVMSILLQLERLDELEELFDQPIYRQALRGNLEEDIAIALGLWGTVVMHQAKLSLSHTPLVWLMITVLSAAIWFSIIVTLGGINRVFSVRFGLYGLGFLAGIASTWVVVGVVIWQKRIHEFGFNGDLANDLIFCISGIGLREEVVKLLFFAPFLPILLKRRSAMEALGVAACVGLGFAAEENLGYFGTGRESAVFGRFLTANFFHASLTGLAGLALFQFARWPKSRWEELIGTFIAVVLAHGLYDALAGLVPILSQQYSIFGIVIFAVVCNFYINKSREVREGGPSMVSPLGTFVIGSATLVAASWILACATFSLDVAMPLIGNSTLGLGIIAFLFINQFRNE